MSYECRHEQEFLDIREKFKEMKKQSATHITWTVFIVIVGIYSAVFGTLLNITYQKTVENASSAIEARVQYARFETQMTQIQKDILDIKILLEKHSDVKR